MDARKLKKQILYAALDRLRQTYVFEKGTLGQQAILSKIFDLDNDKITRAKKERFLRVLNEMLDNAESKI